MLERGDRIKQIDYNSLLTMTHDIIESIDKHEFWHLAESERTGKIVLANLKWQKINFVLEYKPLTKDTIECGVYDGNGACLTNFTSDFFADHVIPRFQTISSPPINLDPNDVDHRFWATRFAVAEDWGYNVGVMRNLDDLVWYDRSIYFWDWQSQHCQEPNFRYLIQQPNQPIIRKRYFQELKNAVFEF